MTSQRAISRFRIVMMLPIPARRHMSPGYHERFFGEVEDVRPLADPGATELTWTAPDLSRRHSTGGTLALLVAD